MTKPSITIDLVDYLTNDLFVYGHYTSQVITQKRAKQILELDPTEQYVHVEFLDDKAILWDKKRWIQSEELNNRRKAASDRARAQYYLDDENIEIVSRALAKVTGINAKNAELLRPLAIVIIKEKKFDSLPCLNLSELKVRVE